MDSINTKEIVCNKGLGGKGEMVTCSIKGAATEVYIHPDKVILANAKCDKFNGSMIDCEVQKPKPYVLGEMYRADFDYCGMLREGEKVSTDLGVRKLQKLFDSYEDVNYHSESEPLSEAIDLIKARKTSQAKEKLQEFNRLSSESLKGGVCLE